MACGRPVIGSAVGGITYTVAYDKTGFLVPPRDPAMLAARLYHLLIEPGLRERMGRAARRRVETEFTWPMVATRTARLYEDLLADARPLSKAFVHIGGAGSRPYTALRLIEGGE